MMNLILPIYLSFASRFHGGGFFSCVRPIRDAVFAAPYALCFIDHPPHAFLAFVFAYVGTNIGHEEFWNMGSAPSIVRNGYISRIVSLTGLKRDSLAWCWLGMGIKGAFTAIGTLNPLVILCHAVAFPLSYQIGLKTKYDTVFAEYFSGLLYGLILMGALS